MSTTLQNSIWPNAGGTLGEIKTQIPDGVTIQWPDGDALVDNFVYQNGKLVGFVDTKALTTNSSKSTTIDYDYVNIELPFAEDAMTINRGPRNRYLFIKFNDKEVEEGGSVIVTLKYKGCKTVDDVKAVDADYLTNDIIDGAWSEGLGDLEYGSDMFLYCSELESFTSDLSSLTNGEWMFSDCYNLTTFFSDLSSLTNGYKMFGYCHNLATFNSDLSSLTNGYDMFTYCDKLESFTSDLSSLIDGNGMFKRCKLDTPSVKNIIATINTYSGSLTLGIGCNNTTEDIDLFAQEVGYENMTSLLAAFDTKGWSVYAQYNGRPTTTYSLRRPSEDTLPVFVKLEEVEETEKYVNYTSKDGAKKYILNWFHETTGSTEGYTQFNSLEEAIAHFNIKPIERN